ncbi:sirohydrochlorin chelatase [Streptomyces calidiresistens]|uniref:Sirohydrochlorin chelatase n=1 Tax=Streptomyces calidiresistens TaxID=1485586 RepID=A0A7W3XWR2_9ACTN|nr:sirohydrochlorin chelatase [Streptomyces calidiresistens]MBB0230345.1 sirohydrochlorin chelatase [Streptomyces calidiresistens]
MHGITDNDTAPVVGRPSRTTAPPLLIVAHGSRDPRHPATVALLAERVRTLRPDLTVRVCHLEFNLPGVAQALSGLYSAGGRRVIALPLLLTRAFHAKTDIPGVLAEEVRRLPGLRVEQADVLGPDLLLRAAMTRRLHQAGLCPAYHAETGVVLAAAGSSDPEAIAVIAETAREWRRAEGWRAVRPAFASASPPTTADAVRALRAEGVRRVAVAPYVIAPGRLPDRILRGAEEAGADVVAPVLGDAPELARLMLRRYDAALAGRIPRARGMGDPGGHHGDPERLAASSRRR